MLYTFQATVKKEDGVFVMSALPTSARWRRGYYVRTDGDVTDTYDAAGNVARIERDGRPTLDLTWNSQYQLVSVSTNSAFAESYAYDALNRRISTTTQEGTTRHVYDDNWQCIADIDEQGNIIASYVWGEGIDRLLAVTIGGATYYPLTDIQGTVWGYVDSQNNVVARWQYDAWGNVLSEEIDPSAAALASLRYRFQGREWSAATGLINFRMRWYDAETGRWLSKDPIGIFGGVNLYDFCGNAPVLHVDPRGEFWPAAIVVAGVGVVFYVLFKHAYNMKKKMDSADVNDLQDVVSKAIDCAEDTMTSVSPVFGPPMPDVVMPLTDVATGAIMKPVWHEVFDKVRPCK